MKTVAQIYSHKAEIWLDQSLYNDRTEKIFMLPLTMY